VVKTAARMTGELRWGAEKATAALNARPASDRNGEESVETGVAPEIHEITRG